MGETLYGITPAHRAPRTWTCDAQSRAPDLRGSAHFPLSPLRPLGPEKEKGADTAFGPPPPFSGEGNRGSWAGLPSGPALRDMKEKMRGQATAVTVPRVPRGGGRLSRSARWPMRVRAAQMFRLVIHKWIERIVSYLSLKRASRALVAGSGACSGLIPVHETSVVGA